LAFFQGQDGIDTPDRVYCELELMMIERFENDPSLPEDLVTWYAESEPGDTLYIAVPQLEWHIRLTR